jgi:hypothetical protein
MLLLSFEVFCLFVCLFVCCGLVIQLSVLGRVLVMLLRKAGLKRIRLALHSILV